MRHWHEVIILRVRVRARVRVSFSFSVSFSSERVTLTLSFSAVVLLCHLAASRSTGPTGSSSPELTHAGSSPSAECSAARSHLDSPPRSCRGNIDTHSPLNYLSMPTIAAVHVHVLYIRVRFNSTILSSVALSARISWGK